ncbi:hypothetical protein [Trujillonella endophytica]|uniref:Uncharacterized protein n=1 Tax=Trujillonella endophytica TaxID=673521 RepID=A0A1H8UHR2_9ACTN|nr:hypothetical protein [Trujillella endophytica]SEP02725.1 hypothetical protein SAMN05660991_02923 [Trujillella endophytica]
MTTTRIAPLAGAVLAGGLGLLALTGCSFTSENFSCDTNSCSVTLDGSGAEVNLPIGPTIELGGVENGRASISVGGASVSCAEGERVSAGGLSLECTSISGDEVKLTASLN